jgi:hypothetical protein
MDAVRVVDADRVALPVGGTPCFAKLNGLAWQQGFSVTNHGVRISVRSNSPQYLDVLRALLPPGTSGYAGSSVDVLFSLWAPTAPAARSVRQFTLLYLNDGLLARDLNTERVVHWFEQNARIAVAALCPDHVFIHAGVVAWNGRAVVVPGPSGSGKSELVRALLDLGATYYSDEYAIIGPTGEVEPYPRPLSLRTEGAGQRHKVLPPRVGDRPMPVGFLLFTKYGEGAHWRPCRLSPAGAAMGLMSNSVAARVSPEHVLRRVSDLSRSAPAFETPRGEADDVAAAILQILEDDVGSSERDIDSSSAT